MVKYTRSNFNRFLETEEGSISMMGWGHEHSKRYKLSSVVLTQLTKLGTGRQLNRNFPNQNTSIQKT